MYQDYPLGLFESNEKNHWANIWYLEPRVSLISLQSPTLSRPGNGYPTPKTRWVKTPLGSGFGQIVGPTGLLMGKKRTQRV
jgi:hypothetical protein